MDKFAVRSAGTSTNSGPQTRNISISTGINVGETLTDQARGADVSVNSLINQMIEHCLGEQGVDTSKLFFPRASAFRERTVNADS